MKTKPERISARIELASRNIHFGLLLTQTDESEISQIKHIWKVKQSR